MGRLALLISASALLAQAPAAPDPIAVPNAFARAYNEWAHLYAHRVTAVGMEGIDMREKRAFDQLTERWNDLRKYERAQF